MKKKNIVMSLICSAAILSNMFMAAAIPASADEAEKIRTYTFTNDGIKTDDDGDGAAIDGTSLTISKYGYYRVTGACDNGSIKVKKGVSAIVELNDLSLKNETSAPLVCAKNSKADIIVTGTVSLEDTVKNSEDYWLDQGKTEEDEEVDNAENAVIKLKGASEVDFSGDGVLNIKAHAKNGIKSGATLDAELEEELAADPESDYYAYLTMNELTVNIDTTDVYIPESDDSTGSAIEDLFGQWGGGMQQSTNTYGDGINAESCLNIESGVYNIKAGDDAIHCDYTLNIGTEDGENDALDINIEQCNEGIEAPNLNFYSGDIDINASDDAINAANSDLTAQSYQFELNFYGGDIYAASTGDDSIDSNGRINSYGGKIIAIAGPNGNAFDTGLDDDKSVDDSFNIYGGTILGIGQTNMAVQPSSASTQGWAVWSGGNSGRGGNPGRPGSRSNPSGDGMLDDLDFKSTDLGFDDDFEFPEIDPPELEFDDSDRPSFSDVDFPGFPFDDSDRPSMSDIDFPGNPFDDSDRPSMPGFDPWGTSNSGSYGVFTEETAGKITLTSGETTGIAVGSAPNVTANSDVKVIYDGKTEVIGTKALSSANYVIFSGDVGEKEAKSTDSADAKDTDTAEESTAKYTASFDIKNGSITVFTDGTYQSAVQNQTTANAVIAKGTTDKKESVTFAVVPDVGYELTEENIKIEGKYGEIQNVGDWTSNIYTYKVTDVESDLKITITPTEAQAKEEDGHKVTFEIENGTVTLYTSMLTDGGIPNQTYGYTYEDFWSMFTEPDRNSYEHLYFTVVPNDGYTLESVDDITVEGTATGIRDTHNEMFDKAVVYEVYGVEGDVVVKIKLTPTGEAPSTDTSADTKTSDTEKPDTETPDTETDTHEDAEGFIGTFVVEGGKAQITTYQTQDYENGAVNQTSAAARDSKTGEIVTDGSGQINFTVNTEEGYKVASVTATEGAYKNIKGPDDTGLENTYRITKITDNLTITITLSKDAATDTETSDTEASDTEKETPDDAEGFTGTFVIEGGSASITTYKTQDYTQGEENQTSAAARDSETGEIMTDGSGQINFTVVPEEGYKVESVTATEGAYKNVKGPEDTGLENTYRVTKITDNLTITVTLAKDSETTQSDTDTKEPDTDTEPVTDTDKEGGDGEDTVGILFGDIDLDDSVTSADALLLLRQTSGLTTLTVENLLGADVNSDTAIDSADALLILRFSAGFSDEGSLAGVRVLTTK